MVHAKIPRIGDHGFWGCLTLGGWDYLWYHMSSHVLEADPSSRHMKKTSPAGHGASSVSLDWLSWPLLGSQNGGETWAPLIRGAAWVTFGWTLIGKNDGLIYILGIINCILPNVVIKNGKWFGVGE